MGAEAVDCSTHIYQQDAWNNILEFRNHFTSTYLLVVFCFSSPLLLILLLSSPTSLNVILSFPLSFHTLFWQFSTLPNSVWIDGLASIVLSTYLRIFEDGLQIHVQRIFSGSYLNDVVDLSISVKSMIIKPIKTIHELCLI